MLQLLLENRYPWVGKWVEAGLFNNDSVFLQMAMDRKQLKFQADKHLVGLQNDLLRDLKSYLNTVVKNIIDNARKKVATCLSNLQKYLESLDKRTRDDFYNEAKTLPITLSDLIDSLLGNRSSEVDVMTSIRDDVNVSSLII